MNATTVTKAIHLSNYHNNNHINISAKKKCPKGELFVAQESCAFMTKMVDSSDYIVLSVCQLDGGVAHRLPPVFNIATTPFIPELTHYIDSQPTIQTERQRTNKTQSPRPRPVCSNKKHSLYIPPTEFIPFVLSAPTNASLACQLL